MGTVTKKRIKTIFQLRRATESEWITKNPILRLGEPAFSTDVYKLKIGDGIHHWRQIPYLVSEGGGGEQYVAGNGIIIERNEISLDDLVLNCGTSTTVI